MNNKNGQAMILGIIILVLAIIIFVSLIPAISTSIGISRGCDYLNCAGYIDPDYVAASTADVCSSGNQSFNPAQEENELGCIALDLFIPLLVLAMLGAVVFKLVQGKIIEEQQPVYPGY